MAEATGVRAPTVHKWLRCWKAEGEAELQDRSSRPHRMPRCLPRHRRRQTERLHRKGLSRCRIARETGIPLSTVGAECRRLGLGRLKALRLAVPMIRYERDWPRELLYLDIKNLARIGRVGHRIHGERNRRCPGVVWEFLHVCVDDASRAAYAEILPHEKKERVIDLTERAIRWFEERDAGIQRIMTGNGPGYRSKLLRRTGSSTSSSGPIPPAQTARPSRFIRSALEEWAYTRPYDSYALAAAPSAFLWYFNSGPPHWGIGGRTRQQRLSEFAVNNVRAKHTASPSGTFCCSRPCLSSVSEGLPRNPRRTRCRCEDLGGPTTLS